MACGVCLACGGCAGGLGGPGLALHVVSMSNERRVGDDVSKHWDFVVSADVSFRAGTAARRTPELRADLDAQSSVRPAAERCEVSTLCEWERNATSAALDELSVGGAP